MNPIELTTLDEQGIAERYDIVVDFSMFRPGDRVHLVNRLVMRNDGRGPNLIYASGLRNWLADVAQVVGKA